MHLAATIIGLDGALTAADSPRVAGLCHRLLLKKRPRKQAKVLTRIQIIKLERILMDPLADIQDRIAAGHCLFLVLGRIRWSDAECIEDLEEDIAEQDVGYIQANALGSKTSVTAQQKTAFFPFVATAFALETPKWHQTWIRLRKKAGLVQLPRQETETSPRVPFMPSILVGGEFGNVAMTSDEGSRILRALLRQSGEAEDQLQGVSTHSLKATLLSWLRKWGADPFHSKVAGYHSIQGEGSMFSYARDNVAATLRVIDEMLDQVRTGVFSPDSTRSGYFDLRRNKRPSPSLSGNHSGGRKSVPEVTDESPQQDEAVQAEIRECWAEDGLVELDEDNFADDPVPHSNPVNDDDAGSVESSSESSSSDSGAEAIHALNYIRAPAFASTFIFAVHNFNKTLHKCKDDSRSKTACGRPIHAGYTIFDQEPVFMFHNCSTCFGTVIDLVQ